MQCVFNFYPSSNIVLGRKSLIKRNKMFKLMLVVVFICGGCYVITRHSVDLNAVYTTFIVS